MNQTFAEILAIGGKSNSLGRVDEVITLVLADKSRLNELYECLFEDDPWLRMRAADALEKVCREHPEWLLPYVGRFAEELTISTQPSIQWHLTQIYRQITLTPEQKNFAIHWMKDLLATTQVDWIVAANAMTTLVQFTKDGSFQSDEMIILLKRQQHHTSNSVVKRATKLLDELATK